MDSMAPLYQVRLEPSGRQFPAPADVTVLAAAEQAGIELPSSCRNGTCRTCLSQLLGGQVQYRIEWPGLSAEEKAEGFVLPCVAHACSDLIMRDNPQS